MSFRRTCSRAIVLSGLTTLILMAFGAGVSLAVAAVAEERSHEDLKHNVCEGGATSVGCPIVTGENNVALGDAMMPALTS